MTKTIKKRIRKITLSSRILLINYNHSAYSAIVKPFDPNLNGFNWSRPVTITIEQEEVTPMCKNCKGLDHCGGVTWDQYLQSMWNGFVCYMNYLRLRECFKKEVKQEG